jgi:hypothetical protein
LPTYPQDFDDCADPELNDCSHICLDGWAPVLSYTCACKSGYVLGADLHSCSVDTTIALVALPIIFLLLSLGILGFVIAIYFFSPLHSLPKEVSWSFLDRVCHLYVLSSDSYSIVFLISSNL